MSATFLAFTIVYTTTPCCPFEHLHRSETVNPQSQFMKALPEALVRSFNGLVLCLLSIEDFFFFCGHHQLVVGTFCGVRPFIFYFLHLKKLRVCSVSLPTRTARHSPPISQGHLRSLPSSLRSLPILPLYFSCSFRPSFVPHNLFRPSPFTLLKALASVLSLRANKFKANNIIIINFYHFKRKFDESSNSLKDNIIRISSVVKIY